MLCRVISFLFINPFAVHLSIHEKPSLAIVTPHAMSKSPDHLWPSSVSPFISFPLHFIGAWAENISFLLDYALLVGESLLMEWLSLSVSSHANIGRKWRYFFLLSHPLPPFSPHFPFLCDIVVVIVTVCLRSVMVYIWDIHLKFSENGWVFRDTLYKQKPSGN